VLTLKAFGTLDFRDDACESMHALLAQPKRAALLAYLILAHPGGFCRRDTLLALFWPELDDEGGRHALSQALSFLRRHLSEGVLISRGTEELGVDAARTRSDVRAFEAAIAAEAWEEALGHYQGELLEGLHVAGAAPFTDWVGRERERLREAAAAAAWQCAHRLISRGYLVEAERAGQVALRLVPTDESAVRTFIEALAAGGDRAGALRFYDKFAGVLAQELEVEPARETRAVAERIRNGEVTVNLRTPPPGAITPLPFPPVGGTQEEEGAQANEAAEVETRPTPAPGPWRKRLTIGGAFAGVASVAALAYVAPRPDPLDLTVTDVQPVTSEPGVEWLPSISPDGSDVAYVVGEPVAGQPQMRIRGTQSVPGAGEVRFADRSVERALIPTWTADGSSVRVWACPAESSCAWKETGRMGGTIRAAKLPPGAPRSSQETAWTSDGARVAFLRSDTLFVASETGGVRTLLPIALEMQRFGSVHSLTWSPGGTRLAFVIGSEHWGLPVDPDPSSIWVVEVGSGKAWEVAGGHATNLSPAWMDERRLLFVSNRDSPSRGVYVALIGRNGLEAGPRQLAGILDPHTISYSPATGRLAFARYTAETGIYAYPLDPPEPVHVSDGVPVVVSQQWVFSSDFSYDGRWIVYESNVRGNSDLYKMPLPPGDPVRLTDAPGDELWGMWSPDGREIVFTGSTSPPEVGEYELFLMSAEGGTPAQLTRAPSKGLMHQWAYWSPDGLKLAYASWQGSDSAIGLVISRDSVGGAWSEPVKFADAPFGHAIWGPDGRSVFMSPNWAGKTLVELSIEGDTLFQRDIAATTQLRSWGWAMRVLRPPGSRTLYSRGVTRDGSQGLWAIPDLGRGEPRLIVRFDDPSLRIVFTSIGPDRAYLNLERHESDVWVATVKD
jgi:DNA-binding SARP family transcriptional activator/Tol biopolymer transport system component